MNNDIIVVVVLIVGGDGTAAKTRLNKIFQARKSWMVDCMVMDCSIAGFMVFIKMLGI